MMIRPLDRERLRAQFRAAKPFPHIVLDNFLEPAQALDVARAYPTFQRARELGDEFKGVNEHGKVQITDASRFPAKVQALNAALGSEGFLADLAYITGMQDLRYDASLAGGGIHVTGPWGRLDVHVDFNYLESQKLYRRLNLLLYLNPTWQPEWGGGVEFWDPEVSKCELRLAPCRLQQLRAGALEGGQALEGPTRQRLLGNPGRVFVQPVQQRQRLGGAGGVELFQSQWHGGCFKKVSGWRLLNGRWRLFWHEVLGRRSGLQVPGWTS